MTIIVVHWREWLEDIRVEAAAGNTDVHARVAAEAYVETLPNDRTAFILDTMSGSFTDPLTQYSGSRLVAIYNALTLDATVNKFQDKDTGLRRVGFRLLEIAKSAPFLSQPKPKEQKKMSDAETTGRKGRQSTLDSNAVIKIVKEGDLCKPTSKSYDRYKAFRDGMTVQEAINAGLTSSDIHYCIKNGRVELQSA